jgi:hypothetical protein
MFIFVRSIKRSRDHTVQSSLAPSFQVADHAFPK